MIRIDCANEQHGSVIAQIAKQSFMSAHKESADQRTLEEYANKHFSPTVIGNELSNLENTYHIVYYNNAPVGFSKVVLNASHPNIPVKNPTKLDRLYVLDEFHGMGLGHKLFAFNLELAKQQNQEGMWLYVWVGNHKAINFYQKAGFKTVGSYNFKLTNTHSNPNYQLFLGF
jgi:diamine N-acetyltransferase